MHINQLFLKNFRNYGEETIFFTDGINIITGANAQGKTNSAEAIFLLCTGYSPRANKDRLVIQNGFDTAFIKGEASSTYGKISVSISFNKNDKKDIFVNDIKVSKIGELLGNINSVFFNPSELKLIQESPEDRRRFLNISLSQMSKRYFYALQRYNKILAQRNNLLKQPDITLIKQTLPVWDDQLSTQASIIIKARNDFLTRLSPIAEEKHSLLSDGKETLTMTLDSGYKGNEDEIKAKIYADFKNALERDLRFGFTSIGPHRDDIKFVLNGLDARVYGSQGQQRTIALALKLAETEIFFEKNGEYPVLILDDVLSELDKKRQRKLVSLVEKMQTIFTTTNIDRAVFKNVSFNKIVIENGKVKKPKK